MNSSLKLFTLFGIDIKMHYAFPLILVWATLQFGLATGLGWTGAVFGLLVTLLLFGIVLLHELGHSLAALSFDVPVEEIVLLPIGGVARIREIPEDSRKEFIIAAAGPAVNFAIAGLLWLLNAVGLVPINFSNPAELLGNLENITVGATLGYLWYVNLFIAVFNLIPAFPLDGGRILRAGLGSIMPYTRATQIAAAIGQFLAFGLGLFGFFTGNLFMILIAVFVYMGANAENRQSQQRGILGDITVADAYSKDVQSLTPATPMRDAVDRTLSSFQQDYPVLDGDQLVGMLTYRRLLAAAHDEENAPNTPIGRIMAAEFPAARLSDSLFDVARHMSQNSVEAVPVVEDGRLLGLLTNRDIQEVLQLGSTQSDLLRNISEGDDVGQQPA